MRFFPALADIPLVGSALFEQDIMTYVLYFLVAGIAWFYAKTSLGLSFAAIGENPRAADAAGIPVHKYQYIAMVLNGILGGVGGAYLVLVQVGNFTENMTSGRGYIALAAVILGRYMPGGILAASFLFGAANALQIRLQVGSYGIPYQFFQMIPYIATVVVLTVIGMKKAGPKGVGKPYLREQR